MANWKNLSEKQAKIVLKLISNDHAEENRIKKFNCFEYCGILFKGDYQQSVESFVRNNPDGGDFFVWIQDNLKQLS